MVCLDASFGDHEPQEFALGDAKNTHFGVKLDSEPTKVRESFLKVGYEIVGLLLFRTMSST